MFFFIKTLHLLGIVLLGTSLFGQLFLLSRKNEIAFAGLEDLKRWTGFLCYAGLLFVIGTGLYLGMSTSLFQSEDDLWLLYKSGLFVVFAFLILRQQRLIHKIMGSPKLVFHSSDRQRGGVKSNRGGWIFVAFLLGFFVYISIAKPYLFNNPAILFETIESASDEEVEEVEEVQERN